MESFTKYQGLKISPIEINQKSGDPSSLKMAEQVDILHH